MRMNFLYITLAAIAIAGGITIYLSKRGRKPRLDLPTEAFDGTISLKAITSFFQSLGLKRGVHTPFIAKGDVENIRAMFVEDSLPVIKEGYICLIAGVYEERKNDVTLGKVFYAKGIDDKLKNALDDKGLVKLS